MNTCLQRITTANELANSVCEAIIIETVPFHHCCRKVYHALCLNKLILACTYFFQDPLSVPLMVASIYHFMHSIVDLASSAHFVFYMYTFSVYII